MFIVLITHPLLDEYNSVDCWQKRFVVWSSRHFAACPKVGKPQKESNPLSALSPPQPWPQNRFERKRSIGSGYDRPVDSIRRLVFVLREQEQLRESVVFEDFR